MKLLILGGTRFVGRHLVTAALARRHNVTVFHRGKHSSETSPNVETIFGDRNMDLARLSNRKWDAVIDTCGYLPRTVQASADLLSRSVKTYVFISSVSAYAGFSVKGIDESSPLATLTSEQLDKANEIDSSGQTSAMNYGEMYGGLKALCEQVVEQTFPGRSLVVRPGLIVGPHDYTDRFTYWVVRVSKGDEVLAPGRPDRYIQFIDGRDLADWIVRMIESNKSGVFNANGLPANLTMKAMLDACKNASGSDASFTWVSEKFLLQERVAPWGEMPLWMPEQDAPQLEGFMFINCDRAIAAGLSFRDLNETAKDTLAWYHTQNLDQQLKAGIDAKKEETVLRHWHETSIRED